MIEFKIHSHVYLGQLRRVDYIEWNIISHLFWPESTSPSNIIDVNFGAINLTCLMPSHLIGFAPSAMNYVMVGHVHDK